MRILEKIDRVLGLVKEAANWKDKLKNGNKIKTPYGTGKIINMSEDDRGVDRITVEIKNPTQESDSTNDPNVFEFEREHKAEWNKLKPA